MKKIKLTKGKFALVDDEDYHRLNKRKWTTKEGRYTFYAVRSTKKVGGGRRTLPMHRELMGEPIGKIVDHKDENGLNNQKENLRICTHRENMLNRGKNKNNTSGYKGVGWSKNAKKWAARIEIHRKTKHLGYFDDINEAAKAYNEIALEHFGEFAVLNEIPEDNTVLIEKGD